jgi:hypothetical protein
VVNLRIIFKLCVNLLIPNHYINGTLSWLKTLSEVEIFKRVSQMLDDEFGPSSLFSYFLVSGQFVRVMGYWIVKLLFNVEF